MWRERMPMCVPMPWVAGDALEDAALGVAHAAAHAAPPAAACGRFWRIAVVRGEGLDLVERKLRQLYHTTDGQPCQALLTTEYRQWKRLVLLRLLDGGGDGGGAGGGLAGAPGARCRFPSLLLGGDAAARRGLLTALEAFLPGYHLLYVLGSVDINPHEPVTRALGATKREFCELEPEARRR